MQMGMVHQVLAPRVQHGQNSDFRSQMLRILGDLFEGLGSRLEQRSVKEVFVLQGETAQGFWQGKDHMEIGHRQDIGLLTGQLGGAGRALTRGTVPIAAGIIGNPPEATDVALLQMSALGSRPTDSQIPHHIADRRRVKCGELLSEPVFKATNDLGDTMPRSLAHFLVCSRVISRIFPRD